MTNNNDKFIRDTEFGKLMQNSSRKQTCLNCKYLEDDTCIVAFNVCMQVSKSYFAKDEPNETEKHD